MVQSKAKSVAEYLKEADDTRRPVLAKFRKLAREILAECDEGMDYGMAAYKRNGELVTAFANQKGYIAFYAGQRAIADHKAALKGIDCGKGCIRYKNVGKIDFDVVRSLFENIAKHRMPMC
ncbi:MAG: DUF1801 domain-containing protein [Proteobacteria bacterium]|nr:DUF1801 domain-containing protein [Pseudomonadota bacterium]